MSDMNRRAKTLGAKRAVVEQLFAAWVANPSLRLGQLIDNARGDKVDLFYIEDFDLSELLLTYPPKR